MRGLLCVAILALWTSNVVAPIPGLSDLPSLSDIFSAGVVQPTTEDPVLNEISGKEASAGAGAAGSFALDKGIHLGNPKLGNLDANLDLSASGSKSIGISKGSSVTPDPRIIIFDIPTSTPVPPQPYVPPYVPPYRYPQPPPPTPCPPGRQPHYNVHNPNNRPHY